MTQETAMIIVAIIGVFGSGGLWSYLDHKRHKKTTLEQAQTDAIIALSRIELVRESLRHIEKGTITMEEADALEALFVPYTTLGGNGNGKRLFDQAMALPRQTGRRKERA